MQSPQLQTLQTICKRYGPGRLPHADEQDVGAGYAAATAAFVATMAYGTVTSIGAIFGLGINGTVNLLFAAFALPFVVPAAFLVGVAGWRLLPSYSSISGVVAGGLGTIVTYLVTLVLVGALLVVTAALSWSGADIESAALFSIGLVTVAFSLTWWVTIPIGCLAGYAYVHAVGASN